MKDGTNIKEYISKAKELRNQLITLEELGP
jgi:hypothetical protein